MLGRRTTGATGATGATGTTCPFLLDQKEKLINGIGNNQVDPQGDAVRAQMAAILCRFCENVVK